ncbi:hypothetical protein C479_14188 [Halovivax asiaticus JCM 14624]|uniref:Uncharacterized protein n=1 Tax=Halovivax asiaticus JCM 14624 TaxID=1227490 RepID=M0BCG7_9EURY|nr:hypothetical protein [Halovivax asiaticus]ELZ08495.1 hypothetical protein C479_14188 [Halovivax asiaticus JCM 14624]
MADNGDQIFDHQVQKEQEELNELFGEGTLLQLRKDCCDIYERFMDNSDATPEDKLQWTIVGKYGLDETRNRYLSIDRSLNMINFINLFASAVLVGILVQVFQWIGVPAMSEYVISVIVGLLFYSLDAGLLIAKALVTEVAYPKDDFSPRLPPEKLYFMAAWNKAVIQSTTTLLGLVIYGLISSPGSKSYEIGLDLVEWWVKRRYGP